MKLCIFKRRLMKSILLENINYFLILDVIRKEFIFLVLLKLIGIFVEKSSFIISLLVN